VKGRNVNKEAAVIGSSIHAISQSLLRLFIPNTRYDICQMIGKFFMDLFRQQKISNFE
jgi:hypothetical protein